MSTPITVYILGATGKTGTSIVDALLERPEDFKVIVAIRPASKDKSEVSSLRGRGAEVHIIDIAAANHAQLVNELRGVDAVVSTVVAFELLIQKPLAKAAKEAGVKRFIPCDWATACVPGEMQLHDLKTQIHEFIKEIGLGYTFIDVGWWSQNIALFVNPAKSYYPQVTEYSLVLYGSGDIKTAITDLRDIGPIVARILGDPRTVNQYVFIWTEEVTLSESIALAEKVLGKKLNLPRVSSEVLEQSTKSAEGIMTFVYQYARSLWVRGDNTIAKAKLPEYGGALDAQVLYPDFKLRTVEQVMREYAADLD